MDIIDAKTDAPDPINRTGFHYHFFICLKQLLSQRTELARLGKITLYH